ncbi:MAG: hypothetical protein WDW20_03265 [Neisseriaceae bacterium]
MSIQKSIDELFFTRSIEKKHTLSVPPLRQGYGLRNLTSAANNPPQVMIKIPRQYGNSKDLKGISNHIDYISTNGQLEIEDQEGNTFQGQ